MTISANSPLRRLRFSLLAVVAVAALLIGYEARHARALGIPTVTTLAYSGSLLTFGAPDNSSHTMSAALFVVGVNDGGLGSAACVTQPTTIACLNGQFSIPLSSCESTIQQNPNLQVEVTVDGVAMGATAVTAVPYAVEAGTATNLPVVSSRPASPTAGTVVYDTGDSYLEVYDGANWQSFQRRLPASCKELLNQGYTTSGVFTIQTSLTDAPISVYCDQTNYGGGWTLLITLAPTTATNGFAYLTQWPSTFDTQGGPPVQSGMYKGSLTPFTEVREEIGSGCSIVFARNLTPDTTEVIRHLYGWNERDVYAPTFLAVPNCRNSYTGTTDNIVSCTTESGAQNESVLGFQLDVNGAPGYTWFGRGNLGSTAGGSSLCGTDTNGTRWARTFFR